MKFQKCKDTGSHHSLCIVCACLNIHRKRHFERKLPCSNFFDITLFRGVANNCFIFFIKMNN
ncbi:hypothetical protein SAMN02745857_01436 [Andreprevotia lacus DSM 23236]|uniref:Uncharacterized protein n=1 Tax=Andreprevotia lacus DSM 23236 TaxID=1121001 RepID=A0A1W1XFC1_9NEIS|nr:hypothetical protein SAMN02745857_01436 [Andreprevotia lacus DSM 23236]